MSKPYTPTRTCPHRWCKALHLAPAPFMLAVIAFDMWHSWKTLVILIAGGVAGVYLPKLIHYKPRPRSTPATFKEVIEDVRSSPGPIDLEIQDMKYAGTGWRMLEVHKGWARVAVGCDLFIMALIGIAATAMVTDPAGQARRADEPLGWMSVISLVIGIAFFGFSLYAHKKATQPRKPKRAWVPAFLRTSA